MADLVPNFDLQAAPGPANSTVPPAKIWPGRVFATPMVASQPSSGPVLYRRRPGLPGRSLRGSGFSLGTQLPREKEKGLKQELRTIISLFGRAVTALGAQASSKGFVRRDFFIGVEKGSLLSVGRNINWETLGASRTQLIYYRLPLGPAASS